MRRTLNQMLSNGWLVCASSLVAVAILVLLLWSPWSQGPALSGTLRLYCAAGMVRPMEEIIADYQRLYGVVVQPNYGGSGNLLANIRAAGGAGDLFLSADEFTMREAQKLGLAKEAIPVAVITPVLIVQRRFQDELVAKGKPVARLRDLLRDDLRVVLANPEGAAIGRTTRLLLEAEGLWDRFEKRRKEGDGQVSMVGTVNEVAQRVAMKEGYVGLVWSPIARQFKDLAIVPLPVSSHATEHIVIGVLAKASNPTVALHFARYVTARDRGQTIFAKYDFDTIPDADFWEEVPQIHLSAGAMLEPGIRDVLSAFQEREGVRIDTSYAGCGLLVSQMESIQRGQKPGHFPDAYVSCDISFTEKVRPWFDAARIILENDLVLITPPGNPRNIKSLDDLKRTDLGKIGLPHPRNSAIGKITYDLLLKLHFSEEALDPGVNRRIVHADAAHTLVNQMRSGALDVAVVARSNARSMPDADKHLEVIDIDVPGALATQTYSIARNSRHHYLMERLFRALMAPASLERFRDLGFRVKYQSHD
jgi:molybdenum ABC transporter molybdate-binding protein